MDRVRTLAVRLRAGTFEDAQTIEARGLGPFKPYNALRSLQQSPTYSACKVGTPNACIAGSVIGPISARACTRK